MTIKRISAVVAASSIVALSLSSFAYADNVDMGTTGPGSTNQVTVNNNTNVTETNTNDVSVSNVTLQIATSGDANVSGNTNGGSATTGSASNNSTTTTVIGIGNSGAPVVLGGVGGAGGTGDNSGAGGAGGSNGLPATGAGSTSKVGGAGGLLPQTGPEDNVDVSALRDALLPQAATTPELVKKTNTLSTELLIAAAILSLIGAVGSAAYVSKREKKLA
jgi:hypothetical protein